MELSAHVWVLIARYLGAGLALGMGGIGAAIGMGKAAGHASVGIMRQPERQGYLLRTMLIGQAVGGGPSIFALVVGLLILFLPVRGQVDAPGNVLAIFVGAGLAVGFGGFGSGVGCGWPAGAACDGVARNPRRSGQITQVMLIGQAVAQTPAIFGLLIGFIMIIAPPPLEPGAVGFAKALGAGISVGFGGVGPGVGSGLAGGSGCEATATTARGGAAILRTMLIGQAVSQSTAIYALIIALLLLYANF